MTAIRATQKRREETGPTVRVKVAPNSGIHRNGRWWKGGEVVKVREQDAAKMVKRSVAEWAR